MGRGIHFSSPFFKILTGSTRLWRHVPWDPKLLKLNTVAKIGKQIVIEMRKMGYRPKKGWGIRWLWSNFKIFKASTLLWRHNYPRGTKTQAKGSSFNNSWCTCNGDSKIYIQSNLRTANPMVLIIFFNFYNKHSIMTS